MYLHVVEPKTQTIAPVPQVLKVIDAKYDFLKDYYAGFAIENVVVSIFHVQKYNDIKLINNNKISSACLCWSTGGTF